MMPRPTIYYNDNCPQVCAWMCVKHHALHVQDSDGWPECHRWLVEQAEALGLAVSL